MSEKKIDSWYLWLTIIVCILVLFPYLYGYAVQTEDMTFSGSFIGVDDQNSYLAKMRYGNEGNWLNKSPYTDFPQNGVIIYIPFLILGKLAGGEELVGQMQFILLMLRVVAIMFYIYSLKSFFGFFLMEKETKYAVSFAIFGSGLGFLYFMGFRGLWGGRLPLEFYSPETFSFLALLTLPHIIIARSFLLLSLVFWFTKRDLLIGNIKIRYEIIVALFGYAIFLFQTITLALLLCIIGIHFLFSFIEMVKQKEKIRGIDRSKGLLSTLLYIGLMLPAILYNMYLVLINPYVKAWAAQNILTTPPITDYLLAYGIFLLFGIIYYIKQRKLTRKEKTIGVWIIISLIGIYLPISIQRRFIEGTWIFIILYMIQGLKTMKFITMDSIKMRIAIMILSFSSIIIVSGSILQIHSLPDRVFIDNDKLDLYQYIEKYLYDDTYIFADHDIGNEIPVWSSKNTITGVGPESINESDYLEMYNNYIQGNINKNKFENALITRNINYYVLHNNVSRDCNQIYTNQSYSLCNVGDNE